VDIRGTQKRFFTIKKDVNSFIKILNQLTKELFLVAGERCADQELIALVEKKKGLKMPDQAALAVS
jgi:hypothetical protein